MINLQKFRNKKTGEIVDRIPLAEIKNYEILKDDEVESKRESDKRLDIMGSDYN